MFDEIKKIFKKYAPSLYIYTIYNYDSNIFLIVAGPLNDPDEDPNSNFYLLNFKEKGVVCFPEAPLLKSFSVMFENPDKYIMKEE